MLNTLFIGVMTGTSADGIDICLLSIQDTSVELIDSLSIPFSQKLKSEIKDLCSPSENELFRAHSLGIELSLITANHINTMLARNTLTGREITAIGYHGQTIRHHPDGKHPFSVQIGCGSTLAHHTNIKTVTDFRMPDIAANGQGAPLVPAFHQAIFSSTAENRLIINLGGIANITLIPTDINTPISGLDTGPGNTLLDEWIFQNQQKDFDENGEWAKSGDVIPALLSLMMSDSYITRTTPKSTGKEYFNLPWLNNLLTKIPSYKPEDVQRTLIEFTCESIRKEIEELIQHHQLQAVAIYLCGGGINNSFLIDRLSTRLPDLNIHSTELIGIHPQLVEASAFAWLAHRTITGKHGNLKSVTGATHDKILGCIYYP